MKGLGKKHQQKRTMLFYVGLRYSMNNKITCFDINNVFGIFFFLFLCTIN